MLFASSISFIQSPKLESSIEDERWSEPEQEVPYSLPDCDPKLHHELVKSFKDEEDVDSFPLVPLYVILLLASCFRVKGVTMNVEDNKSKGMSIGVNNMIAVFIMFRQFVMMYQVFMP